MNRVFINGRQLSNEAAAVVLKLYPNGGTFSEEYVYRNLRKITKELLPEGCEKTPTQIRAELDKFISEECTVKIDIEGVTCEEFKRKMTLEDSHQKAMDKLSEMAQKEHLEALEKEASCGTECEEDFEDTTGEVSISIDEPSDVDDAENTEAEIVEESDNKPEEVHIEAPVVQKVNTPKASNSSKKKSVKKKK